MALTYPNMHYTTVADALNKNYRIIKKVLTGGEVRYYPQETDVYDDWVSVDPIQVPNDVYDDWMSVDPIQVPNKDWCKFDPNNGVYFESRHVAARWLKAFKDEETKIFYDPDDIA
jgi:hypothetical protein